MLSASEHAEVVERYLLDEVRANRVIKVHSVDEAKLIGVHCSPVGVIPKKNRPDKWRLIVDLSTPEGHSVNDGISKELPSLSYISVDAVISGIVSLGRGALMAKMDIQQAYRNIPVHPGDRPLLGMHWKGSVFMDAALPFGLRSAPLIFSAVADAAQHVMEQMGAQWVAHYVDDFITLGSPDSDECAKNVTIMHEACARLGLPVATEKDEGPATAISFVGIELDSGAMEIRLPQDKLTRLKSDLAGWRGRKACKKRDLLSLIGVLSHACKAFRAGRSFLRRLIDLSMLAKLLTTMSGSAKTLGLTLRGGLSMLNPGMGWR